MASSPQPQNTRVEITPSTGMISVPVGNIDRSRSRPGNYYGTTYRRIVLGIAFMEVMLSSWCAGLLLYSAQNYEHIVKQWLHLSRCVTDSTVVALLNSLSLLSVIECILGAWLFEAVKRNKLGHVKHWLVILVTYETLLITFTVFLGVSGCTTEQIHRLAFFRVFFRFMEFLVIFIFVEGETIKRMRRKTRAVRDMLTASTRQGHRGHNAPSATSVANLLAGDDNCMQPDEDLERNKILEEEEDTLPEEPMPA